MTGKQGSFKAWYNKLGFLYTTAELEKKLSDVNNSVLFAERHRTFSPLSAPEASLCKPRDLSGFLKQFELELQARDLERFIELRRHMHIADDVKPTPAQMNEVAGAVVCQHIPIEGFELY